MHFVLPSTLLIYGFIMTSDICSGLVRGYAIYNLPFNNTEYTEKTTMGVESVCIIHIYVPEKH